MVQSVLFGCLAAGAGGCVSKPTPIAALQGVSRTPVGVEMNRHSNVPSFIKLRVKSDLSRGAVDAAQGFFRRHAALYKMKNVAQELKVLRATKSANGIQRVRFQQIYSGIEVIGGQLTVHIQPDGTIFELGRAEGYHGWFGTTNTGQINNVDVFLNYNYGAQATNGIAYDQAVYLSKILPYQFEAIAHEAAHLFQSGNHIMAAPPPPIYENRSRCRVGTAHAD